MAAAAPRCAAAVAPPVEYKTFLGDIVTMYPYTGKHVALLVSVPNLDESVLTRLIDALDKTYEYYVSITGRAPALFRPYQGKLTIACPEKIGEGAGAWGHLGYSGIELGPAAFANLYNGIAERDEFDQAIFYEFGRNFWYYSDQLSYKQPDSDNAVVTGYAVFMRFMAMESIGVKGGPWGGVSFEQFKEGVAGMFDRYITDPSYDWNNTLRVNQAPANPLGFQSTDLFAAFLFKLRELFGQKCVDDLWRKASFRPPAATTRDAVDNFILAASASSGKNLTGLFESWRWPVSDKAKREALKRFGNPPSGLTPSRNPGIL